MLSPLLNIALALGLGNADAQHFSGRQSSIFEAAAFSASRRRKYLKLEKT